jgi:hypothetical protein
VYQLVGHTSTLLAGVCRACLRAGLEGAELGAVADGGGVADAEQVGELERVAAAGLGFSQEPVPPSVS